MCCRNSFAYTDVSRSATQAKMLHGPRYNRKAYPSSQAIWKCGGKSWALGCQVPGVGNVGETAVR